MALLQRGRVGDLHMTTSELTDAALATICNEAFGQYGTRLAENRALFNAGREYERTRARAEAFEEAAAHVARYYFGIDDHPLVKELRAMVKR